MSNWFSVIDRVRTGLGITLPRNSPSVHLEIEQYLSDEHRHHEIPLEAVIGNPALSDWLRRTFAIMMNWSEEGEAPSDYAELDQIRLEFDRSYSTFARLLLPGNLTGGAGLGPSMKRELTEAQQALQNAEIASQETEARLSSAAVREAEITAEVARLEAAVAAANSDIERGAQHRQSIEAQLTEVEEKAREHELRNADLLGRLAVAESTMIQRQEELAQLMTRLLESETASAQAIAKEAMIQEQLVEAKQAIAEANDQIEAMAQRSLAERGAAEVKAARLETEIAQITQMLQKQEEEAKLTHGARELAEEALAAQQNKTNQLDAELKQLQVAKQAAESARAVAEQRVADRFSEIARLTTILADEGMKVDQAHANAEWLRSALQLAAGFPKWWAIMPQKWRRKREHARYRNSGLLDAERYLEAYPDVAEYGMDPVRHYILHGMGEGRVTAQ